MAKCVNGNCNNPARFSVFREEADRRGTVKARKTLWKGRRGRFVWHVYRPSAPTRFGIHRHRTVSATYEGGRKFSFSMRWVIGWVLW